MEGGEGQDTGEPQRRCLSDLMCSRGIYLCGHSAGAHLAAMMLLTDWSKHGVTPNLKGARGWAWLAAFASLVGLRVAARSCPLAWRPPTSSTRCLAQ